MLIFQTLSTTKASTYPTRTNMSYLCRELKNNAVVSDKPLVYQEPADFSALPLVPPGGVISEANEIAAIRGVSLEQVLKRTQHHKC